MATIKEHLDQYNESQKQLFDYMDLNITHPFYDFTAFWWGIYGDCEFLAYGEDEDCASHAFYAAYFSKELDGHKLFEIHNEQNGALFYILLDCKKQKTEESFFNNFI